jgi:hypothetical protein
VYCVAIWECFRLGFEVEMTSGARDDFFVVLYPSLTDFRILIPTCIRETWTSCGKDGDRSPEGDMAGIPE